MKKNYAIGLGLGLLLAGFIYSCKREEVSMPQSGVSGKGATSNFARSVPGSIKLNYGWLQFQSLEHFQKEMEMLQQKYQDASKLSQWEAPYDAAGFSSLRKFYEDNDRDTSDNRRNLTTDSLMRSGKILDCPDSWFATMLSKDGNIQIGDTVYCFRGGTKNGESYSVPATQSPAIAGGKSPKFLPGALPHDTSFGLPLPVPEWVSGDGPDRPSGKPICEYPSGLMPQWWGKVGGDMYRDDNGNPFPEHNGREVKLNYHRWRVGYIFYASTGARVQMLKDTRFAGWLSNTYADEIVMEACAKGKVMIPGIPLISWSNQTSPGWPSFNSYAENKFEKTMKWTANGFFNEIILQHFNFHFKVTYRGQVVDREVRQ
ncbi:hypothetical protein [Taibaiella koreensis]|uniref:hypothetical protein n=1 Tax=Taibaiella koreensis TaxID=1268548 RepID=UPI000E59DACB|nr:hypothetical protein [Taibaiella koreensis]